MMAASLARGACAALAVAFAGCGTGGAVWSHDARTAVFLPVEARDAVLAEMRTMLGSVNGVLIAQTNGDTAAMRQAALASGAAAAADPALEAVLPEAWLKLAMTTHEQFDGLAQAVARPGGRDSVVAHLARITGHCVACHAAYRVEPRR
jgi:cytochrome c556